MTEYVAGFMFQQSLDGLLVGLVEKQKPAWQKGLLNGVGGKIEPNETPYEAMVREFKEETSCEEFSWKSFAVVRGGDWVVHFFSSWGDLARLKTMEEEKIAVRSVASVNTLNAVPNLSWLLPMALAFGPRYDIREV